MKLIISSGLLLTISVLFSHGYSSTLSSKQLASIASLNKAFLKTQKSTVLSLQRMQANTKKKSAGSGLHLVDSIINRNARSLLAGHVDRDSSCESSSDCASGYQCENVYFLPCSPSDSACVCIADEVANIPPCTASDTCDDATKVCTELVEGLGAGLCLTCAQYQSVDEDDSFTVQPLGPNPCSSSSGSGSGSGGSGPIPGGVGSEGNSGSNSGGSSNVCIDATLLNHLPQHTLVFEQHRRASVLCDTYGSCATPGHLVTYQEKPMMMSSYCKLPRVSCARKTMFVNSPKMTRGLRVPSRTKQLTFTPLSARYESHLEEKVLSTLVHMGM